MRGDLVIVKTHKERPVLLKVWEVTEQAVFVCCEETFQKLSLGVDGIWTIGVRPEEVFQFNSAIADSIRNDGNTYLPDWDSLPPWKDR